MYSTDKQIKAGRKLSMFYVFLFLFSVLSGVLRKWIFVDNSAVGNVILLVQLVMPLAGIFWLGGLNSPLKTPLYVIYIALLVLLALNPMNMTVMHGTLGFLLHFGFWFLAGVYIYNRSIVDTKVLINVAIIFSVVEIVLGFLQYSLPSDHFLNRYADKEQVAGIASFGSYVRIAGTFSYLGGFYAFMLFFNFLLWTLLRRGYNGFLITFLTVAGMIVALMSASRTTVYTYFFLIIVMLVTEGRQAKKVSRLLLQFVLILGVAAIANFFLGDRLGIGKKAEAAWSNFDNRVQATRSVGEERTRILGPLEDIVFFTGNYPVIGVGLGATYQGATATFGTSKYVQEYGYYEEEGARIILEGGFVLYLFRIFLFVFLFRRLRMPVFAKGVILVYIFLFIPIIFNVYNSIFFFLGLMLLDNTYAKEPATAKLPGYSRHHVYT